MATVIITVRMNEASMRGGQPARAVVARGDRRRRGPTASRPGGGWSATSTGATPITGGADRSAAALAATVELVDGARCGAVTYGNLGAGAGLDLADRLAPLAHDGPMPELAPVDLGSFNLDPFDRSTRRFATEEGVYANTVATVRGMAAGIVDAGVTPVAVAWGIGSLRLLDALVLQGSWPTPVVGELVVSDVLVFDEPGDPGRPRCVLLPFVPEVDASWSLMCALGSVLLLAELVVDAGLGISVGLGDHPHTELGAPTNADLVARVVELVVAAGHRGGRARRGPWPSRAPAVVSPRSGPGTARSAPGATSAVA